MANPNYIHRYFVSNNSLDNIPIGQTGIDVIGMTTANQLYSYIQSDIAAAFAPISVQNQWVQPGLNITTGGTINAPIVNLAGTISLTGLTSSSIMATSISGTSVSATTYYSGSTALNTILSSLGGGSTTYVQPGLNITTGGTANAPIVNLGGAISVTSVTFSSHIRDNSSNASLGIYYKDSSSSQLVTTSRFYYDEPIGLVNMTLANTQAGLYVVTGGVTGATVFGSTSVRSPIISGTSVFGLSVTGITYYSGSTPLNTILSSLGGGSTTYVQPGLNITTGGTQNSPIVNLKGTIVLTGVTATSVSGTSVSATTFYSGTTPLNSILSAYAPKDLSINRNSGTYILALTDDSKTILLSSATAQNCVVPRNAAVAFPIGAQVMVVQTGAGQVTFSADTGVSLLSYTSLIKLSGQYAGASLIKTDTNEWSLVGNLTS